MTETQQRYELYEWGVLINVPLQETLDPEVTTYRDRKRRAIYRMPVTQAPQTCDKPAGDAGASPQPEPEEVPARD